MECLGCGKKKLSKEFPDEPPADGCVHPVHYCLRCMVDHLEKSNVCPSTNCHKELPDGLKKKYEDELNFLFPVPSLEKMVLPQPADGTSDRYIVAMLLNGDHRSIAFDEAQKISDLKIEINKYLRADVKKQKLFFNLNNEEVELKENTSNGESATLGTYGVSAGCTIRVMILLYSINHLIEDSLFDLYWEYPESKPDFLDATAFFYNNKTLVATFDYQHLDHPSFKNRCVRHSGDLMDFEKKIGHHMITVRFQELPENVNRVFFVLSAWNSPTIARFKSPRLRFFDKKKPNTELCENHVASLPNVQAVIMCRVDKLPNGQWNIYDDGTFSNGNAKNYDPILHKIQADLGV